MTQIIAFVDKTNFTTVLGAEGVRATKFNQFDETLCYFVDPDRQFGAAPYTLERANKAIYLLVPDLYPGNRTEPQFTHQPAVEFKMLWHENTPVDFYNGLQRSNFHRGSMFAHEEDDNEYGLLADVIKRIAGGETPPAPCPVWTAIPDYESDRNVKEDIAKLCSNKSSLESLVNNFNNQDWKIISFLNREDAIYEHIKEKLIVNGEFSDEGFIELNRLLGAEK